MVEGMASCAAPAQFRVRPTSVVVVLPFSKLRPSVGQRREQRLVLAFIAQLAGIAPADIAAGGIEVEPARGIRLPHRQRQRGVAPVGVLGPDFLARAACCADAAPKQEDGYLNYATSP